MRIEFLITRKFFTASALLLAGISAEPFTFATDTCPPGTLASTALSSLRPPKFVRDFEIHREGSGFLLNWGGDLYAFDSASDARKELSLFITRLRHDASIDPSVRTFLDDAHYRRDLASPLERAPELMRDLDPNLLALRRKYQKLEGELRAKLEEQISETIRVKGLRPTPDLIRDEWPAQLLKLDRTLDFSEMRLNLFRARLDYLGEVRQKFAQNKVNSPKDLAAFGKQIAQKLLDSERKQLIVARVPEAEFGVSHSLLLKPANLQKKFELHRKEWVPALKDWTDYRRLVEKLAGSTDAKILSFESKNAITGFGKRQLVKYDLESNTVLILDIDTHEFITCYRPTPESAAFPRGFPTRQYASPLDFVLALYSR